MVMRMRPWFFFYAHMQNPGTNGAGADDQVFGLLPWLAAFLRRSLRLRPRMPMIGLLCY